MQHVGRISSGIKRAKLHARISRPRRPNCFARPILCLFASRPSDRHRVFLAYKLRTFAAVRSSSTFRLDRRLLHARAAFPRAAPRTQLARLFPMRDPRTRCSRLFPLTARPRAPLHARAPLTHGARCVRASLSTHGRGSHGTLHARPHALTARTPKGAAGPLVDFKDITPVQAFQK